MIWLFLLLLGTVPSQEPLRVGTDVPAPARTKSVDPVYPEQARRAWIQGMVALDITLGTSGTVEDVVVVRSIPLLDSAAIDAVRQWEYEPMVVDGRAVRAVMTVALGFTLPEADEWVVEPEGEALLRLDGFFVTIRPDGSRTYGGTIDNLSSAPVSGLDAIVSYRRNGSTPRGGSSQGVEPPTKLANIAPVYPEQARRRVQGTVVLEAAVDERGSVGDIRILRSIPPLDPAATEAVQKWEYEPARRDGVAVPFLVIASINFRNEGIDVTEYIAAEIGRLVHAPLPDLEPGGSREFSISIPPLENGAYYDVRLRFVVDAGGTRNDVPTLRQKKTITSR